MKKILNGSLFRICDEGMCNWAIRIQHGKVNRQVGLSCKIVLIPIYMESMQLYSIL